ncbi:RHS repeat protein [Rhizobacter sp. OV335]|uniref:RHS repeat protein n=1 Tax=Rhizobacter sp. OV335 TaxID=1500264 RepID=UPI000910A959|nr:RHS repeat protein [Rhizobacter sp. OV335]SHL93383.1 YD repeat-containing protein [Rhizobacter sp. OV335]
MSLAEHARGRVAWRAAACAVWMVLSLCIAPVAQAEGVVSKVLTSTSWWEWAGNGPFSSYQAACEDAMSVQHWSGAVTYFVDSPVKARCYATNASGDLLPSPTASMGYHEQEVNACPYPSVEIASGECVCPQGVGRTGRAMPACASLINVPRASNPPRSCPADPPRSDPIHPLRGVRRESVDTGVRIGRLALTFTYDSTALVQTGPEEVIRLPEAAVHAGGVLGRMWSSNLHRRVSGPVLSSAAASPAAAQVNRGDGKVVSFSRDGTGQFTPEAHTADRLVAVPGGGLRYDDVQTGAQERYDAATGRLTALTWADGSSVSLIYSDASTPVDVAPMPGYLIQATDNDGRSIVFTYAGQPGDARIHSVTDVAGRVVMLGYASNLLSIDWPDGRRRVFLYESGNDGALTGIVDESGVRYSSYGYDAGWRATSTALAGGVDSFSVSYATPPSIVVSEQYDEAASIVYHYFDWLPPAGTTLVDAAGTTTTWTAATLLNKNVLAGQSQPAGAGCSASTSSQDYDAGGNLASRDDFNGTRSCFVSDLVRHLQVASVSGVSQGQACAAVTQVNAALPTGALKTSTQWHPDWSLPTRVAEPNQITTSVYNGQPDPLNGNATASCEPGTAPLRDGKPIVVLCKQVTQATTDADGHLGFGAALQPGTIDTVRTWTYDADGRVLTANIGSGTTQYLRAPATTADYSKGDLLRVTAPNGEVTTFDRYNKYGQVLQSTREGVVTTYTYDLRQRMLSRTVGTKTTAYEYDAVGQLKKVTLGDGSWVGYEYDDAHRAVAVTDKKGNRIDYVLDNAGNRIDQRLKDPAGELTQSLNALMDALGRQQQAGVTDQAPASNAFPPLPNSPLPLERYEYDAQGNRTKITRGAGTLNLQTRLTYDALERVKEATDAKNGKTSFEYDGGHRTTQVTDPRNLVTQYPRNGLGDATQVISPDTGIENLSYDAARNLKTRTDSRGVLTTYGYDVSDRLTGAVYTQAGQPTETVTLAYSQTGAGFSYGMGRLTSSSYPGGSAQYGYDDQGEVVNDVQRVDASTGSNTTQLTHTVGYGYTLGNLSGINYPSGRQLGLTWVDGE